jgi:uncharacterized protein (DUF1800 family)
MGAQTNNAMTGLLQRLCVVAWPRLAFLAFLLAALAHSGLAAAVDASPIYRFYNTRTATHFYTISVAERDNVIAQYPWFTPEGVVFYAYTTQQTDTSPVYRFFNTQLGTHFYTISEAEKNAVIANYPVFTFEGPAYYAATTPADGRTPLYRFYNTRTSAHFYTTSADERDHVLQTWPWFSYEGIAYYVYTSSQPSGTGTSVAKTDAWRLLNQATFGASETELARVTSLGIAGWIDDQFAQPVSGYPDSKYNRIQLSQTPDCTTTAPDGTTYPASSPQAICVRDQLTLAMLQRDFFTNAVSAPDQLRQRVAWALSQILVTSAVEADLSYAHVMSRYQALMFKHAFGNFKDLLTDVSLSPAMGNFLDSVNNDRAAGTRVPNENYAREFMQLFSIGLVQLNADGTPINDASGNPVPTYDQDDIKEFAKIFTGWTYADPANPLANATRKNPRYYASPMVPYPTTNTAGHDPGAKVLLNGLSVIAGQTIQQDLGSAVQNVFTHPNIGPFISKQLIQRLVTGNPSPAYVQRIATVFANNGGGVRGDLKSVVRAILLDPEARGATKIDPAFGALREPVLMITSLLRGVGGVTDGNRLEGAASSLGQRPFYAPTVFNYFPPDATIPGTTILGPEFALHASNTAVTRANLIFTLVYSGYAADATIPNATGTKLNTQQFESLAGNPAAMVDRIADVLTAGQFPSAARAIIVTAVNAVPATDAPNRARMAVYLMASSYFVQVPL